MTARPNIVVTGSRIMAVEEALGDLKLYRVPERVTVSAKGLKQVAFLDQDRVDGRMLYRANCSPWDAGEYYDDGDDGGEALAAGMLLVTVNDKQHGLGMALPMGGITVFEPSSFGDQLVAEERLRDYAEGQDVEIALGESSQVFAICETAADADFDDEPARWTPLRVGADQRQPQSGHACGSSSAARANGSIRGLRGIATQGRPADRRGYRPGQRPPRGYLGGPAGGGGLTCAASPCPAPLLLALLSGSGRPARRARNGRGFGPRLARGHALPRPQPRRR